jgi:hypothetical protein
MKVHLVPDGPDMLGQLQDAKLKVKGGPLIRECTILSLLNDSQEEPQTNKYEVTLDRNTTFCIRGRGKVYADLEIENQNIAETIYFLPISAKRNPEPSKYPEPWKYPTQVNIYGLMLTRASDRGIGYFARCGVWDIAFNVQSGRISERHVTFWTPLPHE